jgi:tagaturonate epimerase
VRTISGYLYYPDSLAESDGTTYFLARGEEENDKVLGVLGSPDGFVGRLDNSSDAHLFPPSPENARVLRERLPWLNPQPLGLCASVGFGDRLGLATPGHIRALVDAAQQGIVVAPIFAQQSVRENNRTHRTPQQVLDDAMWGVFQTGWRQPWGADADHLKTTADMDTFIEAGYPFFTIDPGEHVDNAAQTDPVDMLREKAQALRWDVLDSSVEDTLGRYLDQAFTTGEFTFSFDETGLLRALAKYGGAIAHTKEMSAHLDQKSAGRAYDLEVSVDETETPTSPEEHFFIASELQRLGVRFVSLAPRFVGSFEKGVDYIGDLTEFETEFARHAAIARHFGNYRLSLHTGSDKFSIYPIATRLTGGLLHLKTAGTSFLEALRVIARIDPVLFEQILHLAIERYEIDRVTYHVSADAAKVPEQARRAGLDPAALLNEFDARQVLHVSFGAILDRFGPVLMQILRSYENEYYTALENHFLRHLLPFRP